MTRSAASTPIIVWIEIAGVSHIPPSWADFRSHGMPEQNPVEFEPVFRAALVNLEEWLKGRDPPPRVLRTCPRGCTKCRRQRQGRGAAAAHDKRASRRQEGRSSARSIHGLCFRLREEQLLLHTQRHLQANVVREDQGALPQPRGLCGCRDGIHGRSGYQTLYTFRRPRKAA